VHESIFLLNNSLSAVLLLGKDGCKKHLPYQKGGVIVKELI